jgi:hypothetical protein
MVAPRRARRPASRSNRLRHHSTNCRLVIFSTPPILSSAERGRFWVIVLCAQPSPFCRPSAVLYRAVHASASGLFRCCSYPARPALMHHVHVEWRRVAAQFSGELVSLSLELDRGDPSVVVWIVYVLPAERRELRLRELEYAVVASRASARIAAALDIGERT